MSAVFEHLHLNYFTCTISTKQGTIFIRGVNTVRSTFESFTDLVEIIGEESALKLTKAAGGGYIYIPKHDTITRQQRNEEIRRDYHKGMTYYQLHIKYDLTERQIRKITHP